MTFNIVKANNFSGRHQALSNRNVYKILEDCEYAKTTPTISYVKTIVG